MLFKLRITTAGESHGRALVATIEGLPAGLAVAPEAINAELRRRQGGYGRGGRMKIERDEVDILSGVRGGKTIGSPVCVAVWNRDWVNWQERMSPVPDAELGPLVRKPRPGHADLAGALKFGHRDIRNVLERASARETAARVAVGAICKLLLAELGIAIRSQVLRMGGVAAEPADLCDEDAWAAVEASPVRCADSRAAEAMMREIDAAREAGDSLGGAAEVVAFGVPPGLGSYATWWQRLDARLGAAMLSVPSAKAVEIGEGIAVAGDRGSGAHDEILPAPDRPWRTKRATNRAGGIEGGVTNGEPVRVKVFFKPIPTLTQPLASVDLDSGEPAQAHAERSDVCVVPAAAVVAEAMMAIIIADAALEKFGGDCMEDLKGAYAAYLDRLGGIFGDGSSR